MEEAADEQGRHVLSIDFREHVALVIIFHLEYDWKAFYESFVCPEPLSGMG
jgi:hypothetical protein